MNDPDRSAQAANRLADVGVRSMTAASPRQVGAMCDAEEPSLLVVEGSLAPEPGLELVRWLRRGGVSCPVLFMCGSKVEAASLKELHELRPFVACQVVDAAVVEYFLGYADASLETPPPRGNLEDVGLDALFIHALRTHWTGRLELVCQGTSKTIFFDQGAPVYCSSNILSENFGQILLRRGVISEVEYEWARKLQLREGIRQGEALVKIGILSHEDLFGYLREQIREKMVNAFGWPTASYGMDEGAHHLHNITRFRFNALEVVFDGQQRFIHRGDVQELWDEYRGSWGVLTSDSPQVVRALIQVFGIERLETLQQPQSVLRLALDQGWDKARALSVFTTLHANHVVHLARHPTALPVAISLERFTPDLPNEAQVDHGEQEGQEPDPQVIEMSEALWKAYLRITSADHFDALGIERGAGAFEIQAARDELLSTYSPMAFDPLLEQSQMIRAIQGIRTKVSNAATTLADPQARAAYMEALRESEESDRASQFLRAEDEFLAGMSKLPERAEEALPHFEVASQLNALEPVYTMYHGWARFMSATSLEHKYEGEALITRALETNPLLDNGYVFLARILMDTGRGEEAARFAEQALSFNPENVAARDIVDQWGDVARSSSSVSGRC
ncbi:MAG: hypothetical protein CMH57_07760 [Myxococcales bacterium]|nr:hypothetical protein [Myxococcales bacterium]